TTVSFYCRPQAEEYVADAGFYKPHEAYYLLKYNDEKQIMRKAYADFNEMKRSRDFSGKNKVYIRSRDGSEGVCQ
ncbi:MAG: hypothetical protein FWF44_10520, partial [Defluviitaleaceae bacterium]|nr:hypothetical protein [Defluviitaleaceae bacterium]